MSQRFPKSGHKYEAVAFRQNFHPLLSHLFFFVVLKLMNLVHISTR